MLKQNLQQKLLQKLSPQQIQLMKLLQLPTFMLEKRVEQEIEENPALEEGDDESDELSAQNEEEDQSIESENEDDTHDENQNNEDESIIENEFDVSDYINDDDTPYYMLNTNNTSPDDEKKDIPFVSDMSFQDNLLSQLGLTKLNDKEYIIASQIIGNIDETGYLQRDILAIVDDLAFSLNIETSQDEVLNLLSQIQKFDPPGVGARDLRECLLIQLSRKPSRTPALDNAEKILENNFNDFTKKHYDKIKKKQGFADNQLKEAVDEILKLNPKPGSSATDTGKNEQYIIPDFIVAINDNQPVLTLNSKNAPELRITKTYADMLETMAHNTKDKNNNRQKEAVTFVKQKVDSAKMFIDAIRQRQNTLIVTMQAILNYQHDYFITGDETLLKPMILKDIADIVELDISTISRVANSKYVQTPFGTFLLKTFFSESMQKKSGEEVSTREVKKILQNCIENESKTKPLTDEELTEILKDQGYNIARRTIAKYREQLNIPVARLRKQIV